MSTFNVKDNVKFTGYAQALPEGQPPIFLPNDIVELYDIGKNGDAVIENSFQARRLRDNAVDMVFVNEITVATPEEVTAAAPAPAPVAGAAPAAKAPKPKKEKVAKAAPAPKAPKAKVEKAPKPAKEVKAPKTAEVIVYTPLAVQAIGTDDIAALKRLIAQKGQNDYAFGAVLSHIRQTKSFLQINGPDNLPLYAGNEGFQKFIETELNEDYRISMWKVNVYEGVSKLGLDATAEQRLVGLGYTKLKELVKAMTPKNLFDMLTYGETHNAVEVQAHVKKTRIEAGDTGGMHNTTAQKVQFKFKLHNDTAANVEAALKHALGQAGEKATLDDAFALMAQRYMEAATAEAVPLASAVEALENAYNVTVVTEPRQPATAAASQAPAEQTAQV